MLVRPVGSGLSLVHHAKLCCVLGGPLQLDALRVTRGFPNGEYLTTMHFSAVALYAARSIPTVTTQACRTPNRSPHTGIYTDGSRFLHFVF